MQDIAVIRAYRLTKLHWWINYVNKYEGLYPHLLRNKAFVSSTNPVVNNEEKKEEQKQPSFAEKLRYNFLTLIFKKPKESDAIRDGQIWIFLTLYDTIRVVRTVRTVRIVTQYIEISLNLVRIYEKRST